MQTVDAFCLLKAFLGRLLLTDQQTVEENKTYGERQKGGQNDEFDCVVVAIRDLLTVPDRRVVGSTFEHLLKEILMRHVVADVDGGALSEHDEILFFGRV